MHIKHVPQEIATAVETLERFCTASVDDLEQPYGPKQITEFWSGRARLLEELARITANLEVDLQPHNIGLVSSVWPGGYPVHYVTVDGDHLHAHCARDFLTDLEDSYIFLEGPAVPCSQCNEPLESAYGDPDCEVDS